MFRMLPMAFHYGNAGQKPANLTALQLQLLDLAARSKQVPQGPIQFGTLSVTVTGGRTQCRPEFVLGLAEFNHPVQIVETALSRRTFTKNTRSPKRP